MHTDAVTTHALDLDTIRQHLRTTVVGRHLYLHETVSSTNAVLRELAERGATEGTVVLAEHQTAGRGRAAKPWFSPSGLNLYASVLLRPAIPVGAAPVFAFVASLALADAIREAGVTAAIKWPNDVLVGGRKVAGVRAEMATAGERLEDVILGVGVNLNVTRAALLAALGTAGQAATSLSEHLGTGIDRNLFAARFLNALEEWTVTYRTQGARAVLRAWGELDITVGRRVEVREDSTRFDGRALGVDADGHLQVEDSSGHVHAVVSGEVRLLE